MFIVTTNPSEFAASMNRVGICYNICYSVALALRYIPDVQDEIQEDQGMHRRQEESKCLQSILDRQN